jgi:hypothetical protein
MAGKDYDPHLRLADAQAAAIEMLGAEAVADLRAGTGLEQVEHDWRFEIDTPTGGTMTFNRYATAGYVADRIRELKTETRAGRA